MAQLDDPAVAIAQLAARVQRLEDEREISRVLTRYGFAVDMGDADATATLYTDDTVIDLGPGSTFSGIEGARQLELVRAGNTWRVSHRLSRSLAADDAAEVLRDGL